VSIIVVQIFVLGSLFFLVAALSRKVFVVYVQGAALFMIYVIGLTHKPIGRRPVTKQVRELMFKMAAENPTWGAPRIHGELIMLGFDISERNISRWMRRAPTTPNPSQRWLTFLRNHHEAIAAIGLLLRTVPMIGDASCTSMWHAIQRAPGSYSSTVCQGGSSTMEDMTTKNWWLVSPSPTLLPNPGAVLRL
jgi:hypothetical protein